MSKDKYPSDGVIWEPGSEEVSSQCNRQWAHGTPCRRMLWMQKIKGKTGQVLGREILQRIINQAKHIRLRKSPQLKTVRSWDSLRGKYCKRLPVSYFSLGVYLLMLLETETGLDGPFIWTKMTTHMSSCKPRCCGERQSRLSPARRQQSLNSGPDVPRTGLEVSWSRACLGPAGIYPGICLAWLSFLILSEPWSHLFAEDFERLLLQAGSLPLLFCIRISGDLLNVLVESIPL